MREIVAIVILSLVLFLGALVLYILLRRAVTSLRAAMERRRRALLDATLDAWLASGSAAPSLPRPRLPFDRKLFVSLCLERLPAAAPATRARLVAWLESTGFVGAWIRQLQSRNAWRRAAAAERLGIVRSATSVEPLVIALDDPTFDVRMRAAKALGALGGVRARQALIGALGDENRWSVIRIADLLAEMGPDVVAELIEAFPGVPRASRLASLDLIAQIGDATATPFLVALLDDLDRDVRARAASALGRVGDQRACGPLAVALHDAEWPVRAMAAKALGERGGHDAVRALGESLRDREWWVRCNAAEALARLGPEGLATLTTMLDDQDRFARDQALSALESSGELVRRLAGLVADDGDERRRADGLLHVLTARFDRGRLEAVRDRQPDARVRAAMQAAIGQPGAVRGGAA